MMEIDDLGKNPVPGGEPAGQDVRFDPDFEAISAEMEKLSSPTAAAGGLDWSKVAGLSAKILAEKSKDLLVACYLCAALLQTEGLKGLARGVHVLRDLMENFWDTLYPAKKRMKGRINALIWWKERVEATVSGLQPETWRSEDLQRFLGDFSAINDFLGEHAEDAPLLSSLMSSLSDRVQEEQEAPETPPPAPAHAPPPSEPVLTGRQETSPAPRAAVSSPAPAPDASPKNIYENGLDLLARASDGFMAENPFNSLAYRLNRAVAWMDVDAIPPAEGRKTMLPPPDGQVRAALDNLHQAGNFRDLLESSESRIREYLFWLDLSRFSAEALDRLGHPEIAAQVAFATWSYSLRLPGLEKLSFSDGTPFADEETRQWLKKSGQKFAGASGAPASAGTGAAEEVIRKALEEAETLMKSNQLPAGVASLRNHMGQAASSRERLLWQVALCRLLVSAKQSEIASPYLESVLDLLKRHHLEEWEPSLAADALEIVLTGLHAQPGEPDEQRMLGLKKRIAFLDPAKAMEI